MPSGGGRRPAAAPNGGVSGLARAHGVGYGSFKYVIKQLEQRLQDQQSHYTKASELNEALRARERVLLENVTAQGDNLHFLALAMFEHPGALDDPAAALLTQSLLKDVQVHELLETVGSITAPDEPYTTRCMREAFTPSRVAAARSSTLEQLVEQLRGLTLKISIALHTDAAPAPAGGVAGGAADGAQGQPPPPLLSYSLDELVDEYTELAMLLHVVADRTNLQLGMVNFDSMQLQDPPPGHWKRVLSSLPLRPDQITHLCAGFQVYTSKTAPLVATTHRLVREIQHVASSPDGTSGVAGRCLASRLDRLTVLQDGGSGGGIGSGSGGNHGSPQASVGSPPPCIANDASSSGGASTPAAAAAAATTAAVARRCGDRPKPWQEFGLASGGLNIEQAELLDGLLTELSRCIMKLRELHRNMTFGWLNTLDKHQKAISIVRSFPFWSQPLAMLKHLVEEHGTPMQRQQQQQPALSQMQPSTSSAQQRHLPPSSQPLPSLQPRPAMQPLLQQQQQQQHQGLPLGQWGSRVPASLLQL